jgi:hypothetical protein
MMAALSERLGVSVVGGSAGVGAVPAATALGAGLVGVCGWRTTRTAMYRPMTAATTTKNRFTTSSRE